MATSKEELSIKTYSWGVIGFNRSTNLYYILDMRKPSKFKEVLRTVGAWNRYSEMTQKEFQENYSVPSVEEWRPYYD